MSQINCVNLGLKCVFVFVAAGVAIAGPAQPFSQADRATTLATTSAEDVPYLVYLDSRVFLPRGSAERADESHEKVFVQFQRTLTGDELAALGANGVVVFEALEPFTYLTTVTPSAAAALAQNPLFLGLETIQPSDKMTASLYLDAVPEHARRADGQAALFFRFYDDVSLADALAVLDGAGVSVSDRGSFLFGSRIQATAKREQILAACQSPLVRAAFEIPPPYVINNAQSGGVSNVPAVQVAPYGLTGSGIAVGVWDEGRVRSTHLDLTPRVTLRETDQPESKHSTHVTGTIVGSGFGNASAKGMAPAASAYSYDFNDDVATEQANATALTSDAIVLSNNSWGFVLGWYATCPSGNCTMHNDPNCFYTDSPETSFGAYDSSSLTFDALVRTKKFVFVKSAGNDGNDCGPSDCFAPRNADCDGTLGGDGIRYDLIDPIGVAKNVLTVGSVSDVSGHAVYSSAGPADDGRFKPEVVADGGDLTVDNGVTSTCNASDSAYCVEQGTSMAGPVVSGIVALIDQAWKNLYSSRSPALNKPTPELVKALLINTAADLGRPGPDYLYGFGLAKAKEAIDALQAPNAAGASTLASNQVRIGFVSEGELLNYKVSTPVGAATGQMKTTVAWTDVEGSSASIVRYCNFANAKVACTTNADCCCGGTCQPAPCGAVPCNLKNDIETLQWNVASSGVIGFPYVPPGVGALTANSGAFINHVDPVEQIVTGSDPTGGDFPLHVFGFTVASGQQRVAVVSNKKLIFFPANDNFANARTLPALLPPDPLATQCASGEIPCPATLYRHNTWDAVNYDAGMEAGEPAIVPGNQLHSVWFKWVAPFTGQTVFDTAGADYDTILGVYTGASVGALTGIAGDDDTVSTHQSRVSFTAIAGTTYYIQVSGYFGITVDKSMGVFPLNYYQTGACGDGAVQPGETCDDGNTTNGDCCSSLCAFDTNGSACGANACVPSTCNGAGGCVAGAPIVCNDGNICTNDSCNPATGCVFANNTNPCNDGSACTTNDACSGGSCVGVLPPALPGALLSLGAPSHTGLAWAALTYAVGYDAVRGDLGALRGSGGNFTTSTTTCLADDQPATSLGDAGTPAPGAGFFYLLRGTNCSGSGTYDTGSPRQIGSRDAEVEAAPITCTTSCARNKCVTGTPFDSGCGGCIASVCAADSFCCDPSGGWDVVCVSEVYSVCSSVQCVSSCAHGLCSTGGPLSANCDNPPVNPSCTAAVCATDPFCCNVNWDAACVGEVATVCGKNCN